MLQYFIYHYVAGKEDYKVSLDEQYGFSGGSFGYLRFGSVAAVAR